MEESYHGERDYGQFQFHGNRCEVEVVQGIFLFWGPHKEDDTGHPRGQELLLSLRSDNSPFCKCVIEKKLTSQQMLELLLWDRSYYDVMIAWIENGIRYEDSNREI